MTGTLCYVHSRWMFIGILIFHSFEGEPDDGGGIRE